MTPESLQPLTEWALQFDSATWAMTSLALALGWALSMVFVWTQRRQHSAPRDNDTQSLQRAAASQALANTLHALEATEHHRDSIQALSAELTHWIDTLVADPGDLTLKSQLSAVEHALDMAWADLQTAQQARQAERIEQLNDQLHQLKVASPPTFATLEAVLATPRDIDKDQALGQRLNSARQSLEGVCQWHDQPGRHRHHALLAGLSKLQDQLRSLEASLAQTINALTETQSALESVLSPTSTSPAAGRHIDSSADSSADSSVERGH